MCANTQITQIVRFVATANYSHNYHQIEFDVKAAGRAERTRIISNAKTQRLVVSTSRSSDGVPHGFIHHVVRASL